MKKVLLTTVFSGYNYGSSLQALATKTILKELGYDCRLVAMKSLVKGRDIRIKKLLTILIRSWLIRGKNGANALSTYKGSYKKVMIGDSVTRFANFTNEYLEPQYMSWSSIKRFAKECVACFAGSDQIWNSSTMYVDPLYYLRFAPAEKRIAFAPSFGRDFVAEYNKKKMSKALTKTDFHFPGQKSVYNGKVRDVYNINDEKLIMVATDRISAFDVVLPEGIPYKGQMLNQIAAKFLDATADICPNWKLATPDPMVTVGVMCEGFPVEMIVRGYLCGSAWRAYKSGVREICGVRLPEGMRENEKFPQPIITPTTKAEMGLHDEDISKEEILAQGLATPEEYATLEKYTLALFERGTQMAAERGLILVDTKYEFGKHNGQIYLMDEIHTPDSSRYFYSEGYQERFEKEEPQKQLSKEFVREWLMENGFQGKEGQQVPEMTPEIVNSISERYMELFEHITGEKFVKADTENIATRIEKNVTEYLK